MGVGDDGRPSRRAPRPEPAAPAPAGPPPGLDVGLAVRAGLNGLVFVAPAALVGVLIADDDGRVDTWPSIAIAAVQVLGFCFAGWVVRRLRPGSAMATCVAAGLACWATLQAVGIVTSVVRGEDLAPLRWVATALLAAVAASAGGLLARVERVDPSSPTEDSR